MSRARAEGLCAPSSRSATRRPSDVRTFAFFLAVLLALLGYAYWYHFALPGRPFAGTLPALSAEEAAIAQRLKQHITTIASTPHNTKHPANLEAAARYIEETLSALGYPIEAQEFDARGVKVRNIAVSIEPAGPSDGIETIVVGAHYDSYNDAPGANDNGSGVAAVLELARLLKDLKPARTRIRLVLFVNEELPHFGTETWGARRFARRLVERKERVRAMLSIETIGYFSDTAGSQRYPFPLSPFFPKTGNFIAFVGTLGARPLVHEAVASFRRHTSFPTVGGVAARFVEGITWSDHKAFSDTGFPAIMITDTALFRYPHYHRPSDTPDKLAYDRIARITKGLERVVRDMAR
ncbi:MAG: M20/M25/M40 family metallo-hydrolase [Hyphomicrobiaceae bacterium]|nr:MAG: M20/M25/M40 family metallo-hydrolase [Hyphomicrobiaceae bacterium]